MKNLTRNSRRNFPMNVAFLIVLTSLLSLSGCLAQEAIPAPRTLQTITPVPSTGSTTSANNPIVQTNEGNTTSRAALPADPELIAADFLPGKANTYSSVYIKGNSIAMTFDDGPSAEFTGQLLDELKKRNIKATFFMVGQCVVESPALVKRMVTEGHEVANHSWSHPAFAKMSDAAVREQLQKTQNAIVAACGVKPTLMRPPYGSITAAQKRWIPEELGLQIILWSVDPLDWKKPGESAVRSRIVNGAESGAIILAHDIHGATVRAMPETFDQLMAKGYQFATVSELLAMEQRKPAAPPKVMVKAEPLDAVNEAPTATPVAKKKKAQ